MAKTTRKQSSTQKQVDATTTITNNTSPLTSRHRLKCKNAKQKEFANLITEKEIVIASGPAGVGKSYVAIARAIELLNNKTNPYKRIIISKPAIEADENHGFLPGDLKEKMAPHVASSIDIIDKIVGASTRLKLVEQGLVQVEALAFIRGKTIDNAILIMEEGQNMSPNQVKTLLTRIGSNSKFILSGDLDQSDRFRDIRSSGLWDVIDRHKNIPEIGFFEFTNEDIVRNPIISKILNNYKRDEIPVITKKPVRPKVTTTTTKSLKISKPTLLKRVLNFFKL